MRIKKAVKKIVALTTGVIMLGATVLGATATDLSQYPNPLFIKDGNFNGLIVIGADASTSDMLGAMDIISALQATTMSGTLQVGTEASVNTIGDVYKVEKSSNALNIGESLRSIKKTLTDEELPIILKDGEVKLKNGKKYHYEQEIELGESTDDLVLQHFSDKDYKDGESTIGIPIEKNSVIFTYTLDFNNNVPVDKLEDRKITILGTEYDIVRADNTSLELMQGVTEDTLEEGAIATYKIDGKEYEIQVLGIYDTQETVKFKVNGEITDSLTAGETYETETGVTIGVKEVLPNEAGESVAKDMVEFYLGASKLILSDGEELEVNDKELDDMEVTIEHSNNEIESISIKWTAEEDLFITEDSEVIMPEIEAIKFYMTGYDTADEEEISIYSDDESIKIRAPLKNYEIDLAIMTDTDGIIPYTFDILGESDEKQIISKTCVDNFIVDENVEYFIVSIKNGDDAETHVLEINDIDDEDGVSVRNYDNDYEAENVEAGDDFDVDDVNIKVLNYNEIQEWVNLTVTNSKCVNNVLYTAGGLTIKLPKVGDLPLATHNFVLREEDDNNDIQKGAIFKLQTYFSGDETRVKWDSGTLSGGFEEDDNDNKVGYIQSEIGTKIIEDEDKEYVDIMYPSDETNGDVYIGSKASSVTIVDGEEAVIVQPNKIEVGVAVLDTSLTSFTDRNLIVVGGPAVNRATASLMGKTYPTYGVESGITENAGLIKLIEHENGNVAVIVAGWESADTQRASRVISEGYDISGDEVLVTGTSLTDISVSVPSIPETNTTNTTA